MSRALFIAGTDTGIGKTWISAGLVRALRTDGVDAVGMKPVASGCVETARGWRNEDALALLAASGLEDGDYARINPLPLPRPLSPHLAAASAGVTVRIETLHAAYVDLHARHEFVVVEGAGGWSVPLAGPAPAWLMQADLVRVLRLPVLLVVGLRLGCINHALLSARAIVADGVHLVGWVGNTPAAVDDQGDVVATLATLMPAPLLGIVGHQQAVAAPLARAVDAALQPSPRLE